MSTMKSLSLEAIQKQTNTCLNDLPGELLVEILARVPAATSMFPAKEAARLRAVSRSWNSMISSAAFIPRFISLVEENNNCSWGNGETLLFQDVLKSTVQLYLVPLQCDLTIVDQPVLDFSYISDDYIVIAASDDLLLLREWPSKEGPLIVCNPFTKRWAALPNQLEWGPKFALVCDPQGHRYRVMSTEWWGHGECEGEIFVSEMGEWKKVFLPMDKFWSDILPFHGKLYWYDFDGHLVCYDPFEESFSFFPDPDLDFDRDDSEGTGYHGYSLSVVHGSIRMLKFSSPQPAGEEQFYDFISWELDFKQERWSLIYKSSLCSHSCDNADNGIHYVYQRPIAIHPDGHAVYFRANHGLAFHDLSKDSNSFSKVWVKDELEGRNPSYRAFLLTRPWQPTSACYGSSRLMNPGGKDDAMGMGGPWHLDLAGEKIKAGGEFHRMCSHEEDGTSRGGSFEQMVNQCLMTPKSILSQHEDAIQPLPYIPVSTSNKMFKSRVVKPALMVGVCLQILQLMSGFKVVLHYTPHKLLGKACQLSVVVLYRRSDLVSLLISVLTILLMLLCIRGR